MIDGRHHMPGDPKECRERAKHCAELAVAASSVLARQRFDELARTWLRLAVDLERSQALLDEWGEFRAATSGAIIGKYRRAV